MVLDAAVNEKPSIRLRTVCVVSANGHFSGTTQCEEDRDGGHGRNKREANELSRDVTETAEELYEFALNALFMAAFRRWALNAQSVEGAIRKRMRLLMMSGGK